jgi:hypothetical protein
VESWDPVGKNRYVFHRVLGWGWIAVLLAALEQVLAGSPDLLLFSASYALVRGWDSAIDAHRPCGCMEFLPQRQIGCGME